MVTPHSRQWEIYLMGILNVRASEASADRRSIHFRSRHHVAESTSSVCGMTWPRNLCLGTLILGIATHMLLVGVVHRKLGTQKARLLSGTTTCMRQVRRTPHALS